jgi:hypothetical protein
VARQGNCAPDAVVGLVAQYVNAAVLAARREPLTAVVTANPTETRWFDRDGTRVHPLLLSAEGGQRCGIAGLLALWALPDEPALPWPLIFELTAALIECEASTLVPR